MTSRSRTTATVVVLIAVLAAACAGGPRTDASDSAPAGPPPGEPYIRGTLESVTQAGSGDETLGTILVSEGDGGNSAALTVGADTAVWEAFGGGYEPSKFSRLAPGQTVSAWVSGPVMESLPVQAAADAVVIHVE